jgi:hypothetical protein
MTMYDEPELIWNEVVPFSRYHSGICLKGPKKTIKNYSTIVGIPAEIQTRHFELEMLTV